MRKNRVLWLEDQAEGLKAYRKTLLKAGLLVDNVKSVSDAVAKLREKDYAAVICDIKVLPGKDKVWIELDETKRTESPNVDSILGLELLRSLFNPGNARVKLSPPVEINPKRVIILSVVYDEVDEIMSLGVPGDQIIYKSDWNFSTLPRLIKKIQDEVE